MNATGRPRTGRYVVVGPEPGLPIDAAMPLKHAADTLIDAQASLHQAMLADEDTVDLIYLVIGDGLHTAVGRSLGELAGDSGTESLHLVAVSQKMRHRMSGLEATAALFGVFGSDYLLLAAHALGVSPSLLAQALDTGDIPDWMQKLTAALVADQRPFADRGLIEAVERVELMASQGVAEAAPVFADSSEAMLTASRPENLENPPPRAPAHQLIAV